MSKALFWIQDRNYLRIKAVTMICFRLSVQYAMTISKNAITSAWCISKKQNLAYLALQACLDMDPAKRLSCMELLEHPFILEREDEGNQKKKKSRVKVRMTRLEPRCSEFCLWIQEEFSDFIWRKRLYRISFMMIMSFWPSLSFFEFQNATSAQLRYVNRTYNHRLGKIEETKGPILCDICQ